MFRSSLRTKPSARFKPYPPLTTISALLLLSICHPVAAAFTTIEAKTLNQARQALEHALQQQGFVNITASQYEITDAYRSAHNGVNHVYFRQRLNGMPVSNAVANINLSDDGHIYSLHQAFKQQIPKASSAATLDATAALQALARHFGISFQARLSTQNLLQQRYEFAGDALSQDRIPVAAQYYYDVSQPNSVPKLAWEAVIRPHHSSDWWQCWIDAETGALLNKVNWTQEASYHVYPEPLESPLDGDPQLINDAADAIASPFGWHDTDGSPGAEFTDTRGNNVMAQEDTDDSNDGGRRPDGGVDLIFDFPLDLSTQDPTQYENFAITNLFYWNNYIHDVLYHVGFDEASGNFQENNYGNGGLGEDAVRADTHDGSGLNNANFSSPPDGTPGRMQMFIFTPPAVVEVTAPATITGNYRAAPADFGPDITQAGFLGTLALVDDGSAMPTEACDPLVGFPSGRVAVINRTDFRCDFGEQALNAQNAGASGVIVINNRPGNRSFSMEPGSVGDQITIPSVMIGNDDGLTIRAEIDQGVDINLHLDTHTTIRRDSDIDNGVIAHEYGHGLSIRLTGGASTSSCLFFSQQAGEGWSDFLALALTAEPGDTAETPRGIGRYLRYRDSDPLGGFRAAPYSRDLNINSFTYGDIADAGRSGSPLTIPHGVGTVWAATLWDMYWNLVDRYGFDADLINGNGGNKLALQLVVDGLKMQPCLPTFLDARDAILMADEVNNGGANQCEIWQAFARRGMGISADDGGGVGTLAVTEAFDQPLACIGLIYQDGFEGI